MFRVSCRGLGVVNISGGPPYCIIYFQTLKAYTLTRLVDSKLQAPDPGRDQVLARLMWGSLLIALQVPQYYPFALSFGFPYVNPTVGTLVPLLLGGYWGTQV